MKTPGDWIGTGVLVMFIGGIAAGFLAATDTPTALPLIVAAPFGLVGGAMLQIGVIGWGVALGIRQTEQPAESPKTRRAPEQRQPRHQSMQQPDPTLPPWDQPEGRGYR
jgi:hypothetical protein